MTSLGPPGLAVCSLKSRAAQKFHDPKSPFHEKVLMDGERIKDVKTCRLTGELINVTLAARVQVQSKNSNLPIY